MKRNAETVVVIAVVACVLTGLYFYADWMWHECKQVGHGDAYCFLRVFGG